MLSGLLDKTVQLQGNMQIAELVAMQSCRSHIDCCSSWGVGDILFELFAASLLNITQQHILKTSGGNGKNYQVMLATFLAENSYLGDAACTLCIHVYMQNGILKMLVKILSVIKVGQCFSPKIFVYKIQRLCLTI
jgi:hypothetical protein